MSQCLLPVDMGATSTPSSSEGSSDREKSDEKPNKRSVEKKNNHNSDSEGEGNQDERPRKLKKSSHPQTSLFVTYKKKAVPGKPKKIPEADSLEIFSPTAIPDCMNKKVKKKDHHKMCRAVVQAADESASSIFQLSEKLRGKVCQWSTFASAQEVEMDRLLSLLNKVSGAGRTLMEEKKKLAASLEKLKDEAKKKDSLISQSSADLKAEKSRASADMKSAKSRAAADLKSAKSRAAEDLKSAKSRAAADLKSEKDSKKEAQKEMQRKITKLQKDLEASDGEVRILTSEKKQLTDQVKQLAEEKKQLKYEVDQLTGNGPGGGGLPGQENLTQLHNNHVQNDRARGKGAPARDAAVELTVFQGEKQIELNRKRKLAAIEGERKEMAASRKMLAKKAKGQQVSQAMRLVTGPAAVNNGLFDAGVMMNMVQSAQPVQQQQQLPQLHQQLQPQQQQLPDHDPPRCASERPGRDHVRGEAYPFLTKLKVATAFITEKDATGGRPNIEGLRKRFSVSRGFIRKVEKELLEHGRALHPSERQKNKRAGYPGSRVLDEMDYAVLIFLYLEEPSRNLRSYVEQLEALTGTVVSEMTVSVFLRHWFSHKDGICRPNLVPFDKFRPANIERASMYLEIISRIAPERIKFGDEKHLKGNVIFNRKVRHNPLTGEVPEMVVTSDFRNRYNLTGFCSINPDTTKSAVWCSLNECTNDADQFHLELEYAIHSKFLVAGDVLVLDSATVHTGKDNSVLQSYLWETYGIFLLFLLARAPEWNPMEQVWKLMVQRLASLPSNMVGAEVGAGVSAKVGEGVGAEVGTDVVGAEVGAGVVGAEVGAAVGAKVGEGVGAEVGADVVGAEVGAGAGAKAGEGVGAKFGADVVGAEVGAGVVGTEVYMSVARENGQHTSAYAAIEILSGILHEEVRQMYKGSGLIRDN